MSIKIAINGFGRIGRCAFKILSDIPDVEIVAINDLSSARVLAHLLKYDSSYGTYAKKVEVVEDGQTVTTEGQTPTNDHFVEIAAKENYLVVDGKKTLIVAEKDPANLPWGRLEVDVVLECTGRFTKDDAALAHITAGAKKVVVSAPTKGGTIQMFLRGVNEDQYLGQNAIANASCTTNNVAPVMSVMHKNFGVLKSIMTTVHAVTAEQNIVDSAPPGLHADLRRARSALTNIVPTTTGAAIAVTETLTELKNKFDGIAIRVPVLVGSLSDVTMLVQKKTTIEEVNQAFIEAAKETIATQGLEGFYQGKMMRIARMLFILILFRLIK